MTNEKAIKWLKVEASYIEEDVGHGKEILEAYDMAIEALERDSSVLERVKMQEPCDDAISRQAAIGLADELKDDLPDDDRLSDMVMSHNEGILEYQTKLSLLPSVTPQPKVGEWLKNGELCKCSNCHSNVLFSAVKLYKYCYRCGAKMEVEE